MSLCIALNANLYFDGHVSRFNIIKNNQQDTLTYHYIYSPPKRIK